MGLQHVERRLERFVEGAVAKAFRGGLQPVEIGRRLAREMDLRRTVGVHSVIAPNDFEVVLAPSDYHRFEPFADVLARELTEAAREHARSEGYELVGPIVVSLAADESLRPGIFQVDAELREGPGGGLPAWVVLPDGERIELGEELLTIGRLPDCGVVLSDANVSRHHAELRRAGTEVLVADLGSTNGTMVNGAPATDQPLQDGDVITVGSTAIRFEMAG